MRRTDDSTSDSGFSGFETYAMAVDLTTRMLRFEPTAQVLEADKAQAV